MTSRLLGVVDLDHVWLDDRRRCRWALRGFDLTLEPGSTVAITGTDGGPDAVLDLVAGRRVASRGRVSLDGVDVRDLDRAAHRASTVEVTLDPDGERRLCLPNAAVLVARPAPATIAMADLVVALDDGVEVGRTCRPSVRTG